MMEETRIPPRFIGEVLQAVAGTSNTARMARGEPGLPGKFLWRGRTFTVQAIARQWKENAPCRHGSGETYARKHWYAIRTDTDDEWTLYFERQSRSRTQARQRWWLFSVRDGHPGGPCAEAKQRNGAR